MSSTKFNPLFDQIVVNILEKGEQKSAKGIIMATSSDDGTEYGEVIACGEGMLTSNGDIVELRVGEGDEIIFREGAGVEVRDAGEPYRIIRQQDVFCTVDEDSEDE